jgi:predicted RND superfamily exporter protein
MGNSFFKEYGFRIIFIVVFLLSFIWMGTRRTIQSNTNDVRDWLPDSFTETKQYAWFRDHFPHEQFILISWEGCNLDDPRIELFAQKLVPDQKPVDIAAAVEETEIVVELDAASAKKRIQSGSSGKTPEDLPDANAPRETPLSATVEDSATSRTELAEEEEEPQYFKSVLTGPRLIKMLQKQYENLTREEILERLEGSLIGPDHYSTAMIVTLTKQGGSGKELREVLAKIREIARECGIEPPKEEDDRFFLVKGFEAFTTVVREMIFGRNPSTDGVIMGGPPVDNAAIDYEGERTLYRLAGLCALIGFTVSMICFRSLRLTGMVFWISILAAGIGMASVYFTGGRSDAILLSMPALVYVLAMSGAIHIVNYYHDAILEHGLKGAAENAVRHGWYPCTIAALTTAFGLGSLAMSNLIPITKFGIYSAIGVLATLLLLFLYLPALLYFYPSRAVAEKHAGEGIEARRSRMLIFWKTVGDFVVRRNRWVAAAGIAVLVFFAVGLTQIKTSVDLMGFFSDDAEIIAHYRWLEEKLGPLVPMEVVIKFDNEKCDLSTLRRMRLVHQVEQQIEQSLPRQVGGAISAAMMAPDLKTPDYRGFGAWTRKRAYEAGLNGRLDEHRGEFKEYLTVEGNPDLEEMGIDRKTAVRLKANDINDLRDILALEDGESVGGVSAEEVAKLKEMARTWQEEHGVDLWRISMRIWSLKRDIDYSHFVEDLSAVVDPMLEDFSEAEGIQGVDVVYTGMVPLVYKTQHALLNGLTKSVLLAFVLVAMVMMLVLKSPSAGLVSMLPNIFPVVVVFGFMGWAGIMVDVGTMMTASVALGVAVDDTMHYLTWFREGIDQGKSTREAVMNAYQRCATAMTQTTLIGGLGLFAFAFSTFTPTQRFGMMMLSMLFMALVGDLIFLPSILSGPAGRLFRNKPPVGKAPKSDQQEKRVTESPKETSREPKEPTATATKRASRSRRASSRI